ncbi:MAG: FG-GAP repeat protein [Myxococcales bacterium]|nr:FG-GAP repeat protein [Myxococcales bacterium]
MRRACLRRVLALFAASGLLVACGDDMIVEGSATDGETSSTSDTSATDGETSDATTTTGETSSATTSVMTSTTHGGSESATSATTSTTSSTTGSNAAPIAHDDAYITKQKSVLVVGALDGLLKNDVDGDGDSLVVIAADGKSVRGATVQVEELGGFTYQPPPDLWGDDSFTYTIWDGADGFAEATARIAVNPSQVDLGDVADGVGGFVINGEAPSDYSGNWVDGAGDVNGDGFADLVVGARFSDANGQSSGSGYVVFGKDDGDPVDLFNFPEGEEQNEGFAIRGEAVDHEAGVCVAGVGDIDGDRVADVMIGAHQADGEGLLAGRGYVVFGKSDGAIYPLASATNNVGGLMIDAEDKLDFAGRAVAGAGDVNGDGFADVLLGAYGAESQGLFAGRSYLIFGGVGENVALAKPGDAFVTVDGEAELDFSGHALAGGGDVNGDGFDDVIIGAYGADPGGDASGRAYVVFGTPSPAPILLADVAAGVGGFALDGELEGDHAGAAVAIVGDINGDGFADVAVGAPLADPGGLSSGRVYVVHGEADPKSRSLAEIAQGTGGFVVDGQTFRDYAGFSVSGAGDVDGDGLDDVIVGAYGSEPKGMQSGRAYVIYGKTDTAPVNLFSVITGQGGVTLAGEADGDQAGISVAGAGDVNGDGFADVIVGAFGSDAKGKDAGRSYVFFGGDFSNAVDLRGGLGSQDLVGTAGAEVMVGGQGNDTLRGNGGADVLYGGRGADRFEISDDAFLRIDGGAGEDTLRLLGDGLVLDLTAIPDNALRDVERVDLLGGGNTLILEYRDLRAVVGPDRLLSIDGQVGDTVELDLSGGGFADLGVVEGYATFESPALIVRVAEAIGLTVDL